MGGDYERQTLEKVHSIAQLSEHVIYPMSILRIETQVYSTKQCQVCLMATTHWPLIGQCYVGNVWAQTAEPPQWVLVITYTDKNVSVSLTLVLSPKQHTFQQHTFLDQQ